MEWVAHIFGLVLWVGGLTAAGLMRGPEQPGQPSTQRRVLLGLAFPGLVLALLAGLAMAFRGGAELISGGWFHVKMTLAALLIVLQVLLARTHLRGAWISPAVALVALAAIALARLKPF